MLYQLGNRQPWKKGTTIGIAVKCSSFAVVRLPDDDQLVSCIYYQDPQLHLRARYRNHLDLDTSDHSERALGEQATELHISMSEHQSHCRFLQAWCTTAWDAHKC